MRGTSRANSTTCGTSRTTALIDVATRVPEIEAKLAFHGRTREAMTGFRARTKEARYKKIWAVRLGQQMATPPPFNEVYHAMRRSLRDTDLVER